MAKRRHELRFDWSHRHWLLRPLWLRRVRRRHRWLLRFLIGVPLVLIGVILLLARSPLTKVLVAGRLEQALNLEVDADSVYVRMDGWLVMDRARFHLPGVPGRAGQFLSVARVEANVDWWAALTGTPRARALMMEQPVVTISQSMDDGSLNIKNLSLPASSGKLAIPPIRIKDAGVEIGEHQGSRYSPLRHILMDGWFRPSDQAGPGGYEFALEDATKRPRRVGGAPSTGFHVTGTLVGSDVSVKVENFTLDDWPPESVPHPTRERYADLDLRGDVPTATLRYTPEEGVTASLELKGVGMNLPLEPTSDAAGVEGAQGPFPRFLRMREVSGEVTFARDRIKAAVQGLLEDLAYRVTMDYRGIDENAPFTCQFETTGFRVERNPSLLPYAPAEVRKWLRTFSGPTAVVTTKMQVARGEPVEGKPGEIRVGGDVHLSQGTAAFERFPYRFADIAGHFSFTNDEVRIVEVNGRSPSGATLHADGLITPLDETSEVTVNVNVKGAPMDAAMEEAFGPDRSGLLRALFNQEKYKALVAAGLVQSREDAMKTSQELEDLKRQRGAAAPDQAAGLSARIADLERRLAAPIFDFRGLVDVVVRIHSPRGVKQPYQNTIDISIPSAGLVPEKFPLPIEAKGVKVHILNEAGRLTEGEFTAVGGGEARVDASFTVPGRDNPRVQPTIDIGVRDLPITELLINALPGTGKGGERVKQILRDLRLSGSGQGTVHIAPRPVAGGPPPTDDELGFDADIAIAGGVAEPQARAAGPVRVSEVSGRLRASERDLDLTMTGQASAPGMEKPACAAGPVTAAISAKFPPKNVPDPPTYAARVECPGLALSAPIETMLAVFSVPSAEQIERLREKYAAEGAANIAADITGGGGPTAVRVDITPAGDLSARFLDDRVAMAAPTGGARLYVREGVLLECSALAGESSYAGKPAGKVSLEGGYVFKPGGGVPVAPPMALTWREGTIESPLVGAVVRRKFGDEFADKFGSAIPHGQFDADLILEPGEGPEGAGNPAIRGTILPHSASFLADGVPVSFPKVTGQIEFEPASGVIRQLTVEAPEWSGVLDAAWENSSASGLTGRAQIAGRGDRLTPDLRAILPQTLRDIAAKLSLKVDGPFVLEDATVDIGRGPNPALDWTRFDGGVTFSGLSFETGMAFTEAEGRVDATFRKEPRRPPAYNLGIAADSLKIAGVSMGEARAIVENGARADEIVVPLAAGECYGGRFSARARIAPPAAPGAGREFDAQFQMSGARFSPVLKDLASELVHDQGARAPADDAASDMSRGQIDAEFSMHGVTDHPESRRGRGSFRISGGRVINIPFMTRMVEVSNLVLPGNAKLDYAAGSLYVDGGLVTFDDLAIHSTTIAIEGYGTMTWPGKVLDLRFNSRSERPIPILSALLQGIRDELVTTTVKGKLGQQEVRLQQFPGTRRMIGRAVGSRESDQSRRLSDMERRAREQTLRPSSGGIRAAPPAPSPPAPTPADGSPQPPSRP